ncbi:MAG: hypothetical protein M1816_003510 [Peltula sp. TS41687]|nr:MAG: hypothetical protein M1816_003510 [Peltula sp. TS41687]
MAAQSAHDVVNHAGSVDDLSFTDVHASKIINKSQPANKVEKSSDYVPPHIRAASSEKVEDSSKPIPNDALPPHLRRPSQEQKEALSKSHVAYPTPPHLRTPSLEKAEQMPKSTPSDALPPHLRRPSQEKVLEKSSDYVPPHIRAASPEKVENSSDYVPPHIRAASPEKVQQMSKSTSSDSLPSHLSRPSQEQVEQSSEYVPPHIRAASQEQVPKWPDYVPPRRRRRRTTSLEKKVEQISKASDALPPYLPRPSQEQAEKSSDYVPPHIRAASPEKVQQLSKSTSTSSDSLPSQEQVEKSSDYVPPHIRAASPEKVQQLSKSTSSDSLPSQEQVEKSSDYVPPHIRAASQYQVVKWPDRVPSRRRKSSLEKARKLSKSSSSDALPPHLRTPSQEKKVEQISKSTANDALPPHLRKPSQEKVEQSSKSTPSDALPLHIRAASQEQVEKSSDYVPPHIRAASQEKYDTSDAGSAVASVGSDTEVGRAEHNNTSVQSDSESKGPIHVRSNSMKKPASFKAVSVTKNFLAKAANGSAPSSKSGGDKVTTTSNGQPTMSNATAASRPRLVAKSGSNRDGGMRGSTLPAGSGQGKAPDPSQVWNKNRPIQPPAPKHVTDEELKQQYGIHLATRLQADETNKEAKWADIDDDDDDWAPEIIEWTDGTKITLPTLEEQGNLATAKNPIPEPKDDLAVLPKPVQPGLNIIASDTVAPGPPKPSNANNNQPKTSGLVLKGASEKPTLVAKPPAPVPVKSPWAPLPPVEKVPPVTIKPQPSQPAERIQKESHGMESTPAAPSPAKEIAADDFNRSWRDNQSVPNRELFNSQSGRYEPVSDNRRGSTRVEPHFRQPSVLQRPLQSDQKGPAEPSATFQTNRSGAQDGGWGRRRASSNVSVGSSNLGRRMSFGKGQDHPHFSDAYARRGSHHASHPDSTTIPESSQSRIVPEEYPHNRGRLDIQQNRQQASQGPVQINAGPADDGRNLPDLSQRQPFQRPGADHGPSTQITQQSPAEDPIAMQRKIMRESRELAMKRRREQEAKEEAQKQERIRKKLEALGHAVVKPETSEASNSAGVAPAKEGKSPEAPLPKLAGNPPRSPPKLAGNPPRSPPTLAGNPPRSLPVLAGNPPRTLPTMAGNPPLSPPQLAGNPPRPPPTLAGNPPRDSPPKPPVPEVSGEVKQYGMMKVHHPEPVRKPLPAHQQALPNGIPKAGGTEDDNSTSQVLPTQQSWGNTTVDHSSHKVWGGAAMPTRASISQLWSPARGERGLGNGTFTGDYPHLAHTREPQISQQQPPPARDPGPIGPPTASQPSSDRRKSPLASEDLSQPLVSAHHALHLQSGLTKPSDQPDHSFHGRVGTRIVSSAEPSTASTAATSSILPPMTDKQKALAAWRNLPAQLAVNDAETRLRAIKERAAQLEEQARLGTLANADQPAFKETFHHVIRDGSRGGRRKLVRVATDVVAGGDIVSTSTEDGNTQLPQSTTAPPIHTNTSLPINAGHASRFFPPATEVSSVPTQRDSPGSVVIDYDPNPPPESFDHPAYDGDVQHPVINLPAPKPIVRLPPALTQDASSEADVTTEVIDPVLSLPRQIEPAPSWQDKINGLFGRKPSISNKPQTLTVSSASKAPLEVTTSEQSATVSLPMTRSDSGNPAEITNFIDLDPGSVTSRATDEVLFEEREFGSTPTVKIPITLPACAWQPAITPHNQKVRSKLPRPVQVLSIEPFEPTMVKDAQTPHGIIIEVHMPGVLTMQVLLKASSNDIPRQRASSSTNNHWKNGRRGNKSREPSGNFQSSPRPASSGPLRSTPSIPGSVSNPSNATWARRVSGMA